MTKIFLFIELLRAANAGDITDKLKALDLGTCKFANVVTLADDKLVAELDCEKPADATKAVLEGIMTVDGVVQTNIVAAVRPKKEQQK